ncbi:hypothetical protein AOLI_G00268920 [Acnodon oligacanthus]
MWRERLMNWTEAEFELYCDQGHVKLRRTNQEPKSLWRKELGSPHRTPAPPQKLKCFEGVLDIVHSLSDESKLEFASLCTNSVMSVGKSAVKSFLLTLIHTLGMEAVLAAEEHLKNEAQSESRSPSGLLTTPTKSAASSHNSDRR